MTRPGLLLAVTAGDIVLLVISIVAVIAVAWGGFRWANRSTDTEYTRVRDQAIVVLLVLVGVLLVILALPVDTDVRNALLSLLGLLVTAVVGLAATTHVGNGLAGLMVRSRRSFRPGDFIRVAEQFGRVTDIGLFHTEIQTEDRDLTTIPNVMLVTTPITVVRSSGTIVSASVSLGYDAAPDRVIEVLKEAGAASGLKEPFVHITDLGDFSVTYRAAGLLERPRTLISARSGLRRNMLDGLHVAGIEIVSPSFMYQRVVDGSHAVIGAVSSPPTETEPTDADVDALVFDKAELAGSVEALRDRRQRIVDRIATVDGQLTSATTDDDGYAQRLEKLKDGLESIDRAISDSEDARRSND